MSLKPVPKKVVPAKKPAPVKAAPAKKAVPTKAPAKKVAPIKKPPAMKKPTPAAAAPDKDDLLGDNKPFDGSAEVAKLKAQNAAKTDDDLLGPTDPKPKADPKPAGPKDNSFAAGQLRSLVQRIEQLEDEKKDIADDIKEVYAEAKGQGFDTKILRKTIAIRRKDAAERREEEALIDLYLGSLGVI